MNDRKNVVIIKDTKGQVVYVAYPKMLDKTEINKAINESMAYQQAQEEKIEKLIEGIDYLLGYIRELDLEIKLDRAEITKEEYDNEIKKLGAEYGIREK